MKSQRNQLLALATWGGCAFALAFVAFYLFASLKFTTLGLILGPALAIFLVLFIGCTSLPFVSFVRKSPSPSNAILRGACSGLCVAVITSLLITMLFAFANGLQIEHLIEQIGTAICVYFLVVFAWGFIPAVLFGAIGGCLLYRGNPQDCWSKL